MEFIRDLFSSPQPSAASRVFGFFFSATLRHALARPSWLWGTVGNYDNFCSELLLLLTHYELKVVSLSFGTPLPKLVYVAVNFHFSSMVVLYYSLKMLVFQKQPNELIF